MTDTCVGIKDVFVLFEYRGLTMGITVQSFEADQEMVEVEDYEISMDCQTSMEHPYNVDHIALMINSMLSDGRHLNEKIFDAISEDDMSRVNSECLKEWRLFWDDVGVDHGVVFEGQFLA